VRTFTIKPAYQAAVLRNAVIERQNILIAGSTSSGKTMLVNALLEEIAASGDRVILLDGTVELQCTVQDVSCRPKNGCSCIQDKARRSDRMEINDSSSRPAVATELAPLGYLTAVDFISVSHAW